MYLYFLLPFFYHAFPIPLLFIYHSFTRAYIQITMPPKGAAAKGEKKAVKSKSMAVGRTGDKKRRRRRLESYNIYIYKVLKQVNSASFSFFFNFLQKYKFYLALNHFHVFLSFSNFNRLLFQFLFLSFISKIGYKIDLLR